MWRMSLRCLRTSPAAWAMTVVYTRLNTSGVRWTCSRGIAPVRSLRRRQRRQASRLETSPTRVRGNTRRGLVFGPKSLIKSKKRVADHGEVFTPDWACREDARFVKGEERAHRFAFSRAGMRQWQLPRRRSSAEAGERRGEVRQAAVQQEAICAPGAGLLLRHELLADNIAECRANMLAVFAAYLASTRATITTVRRVMSFRSTRPWRCDDDEGGSRWADHDRRMDLSRKGGKFNRRDFRLRSSCNAGLQQALGDA